MNKELIEAAARIADAGFHEDGVRGCVVVVVGNDDTGANCIRARGSTTLVRLLEVLDATRELLVSELRARVEPAQPEPPRPADINPASMTKH